MLHLRAADLEATRAIAAAIAAVARPGDLVVLAGEMGAGKTAFAQGFGRALGVAEPVTSPTYTLVHSYATATKTVLHHADVYRLSTHHDVDDLAFGELLDDGGIVLVEWGDVLGNSLGDHLLVRLAHDPADTAARFVEVTGVGHDWATRWSRLTVALSPYTTPTTIADGRAHQGSGGC